MNSSRLPVQWVWPSDLSYEQRDEALKAFCVELVGAWAGFDLSGHPIEIGHAFQKTELPRLLDEFNKARATPEPLPWLAGTVCWVNAPTVAESPHRPPASCGSSSAPPARRAGGAGATADRPSAAWLGQHSANDAIRESSLWNVKHVFDTYDPGYLDLLEQLARDTEPA